MAAAPGLALQRGLKDGPLQRLKWWWWLLVHEVKDVARQEPKDIGKYVLGLVRPMKVQHLLLEQAVDLHCIGALHAGNRTAAKPKL